VGVKPPTPPAIPTLAVHSRWHKDSSTWHKVDGDFLSTSTSTPVWTSLKSAKNAQQYSLHSSRALVTDCRRAHFTFTARSLAAYRVRLLLPATCWLLTCTCWSRQTFITSPAARMPSTGQWWTPV